MNRLASVAWDEHAEREERRYLDGSERLPEDADARQRQLVRIAMAAGGVGLARGMQGRDAEAAGWFARSAARYRESFDQAPPGSWGRLVGAVKARLLARDDEGAAAEAEWALRAIPSAERSPIARYAAALAALALGDDDRAAALARDLRAAGGDVFPPDVADALLALAERDRAAYAEGTARVLSSFEAREAYLEDVPVADTVIVLERLAERRGIAAGLRSPLLPPAS